MQLSRRSFLLRAATTAAATGVLASLSTRLGGVALAAKPTGVRVEDFDDDKPTDGKFSKSQALPPDTSHVGLHWRGDGHRSATASVRTSPDGKTWSEWIDLTIDDDPFDADETFAGLVEVSGSRYLEYRVGAPSGKRLKGVTLTAIAAAEKGAGSKTPPATSGAPTGSISTLDGRARAVYRRADWGCDESLGFKTDGSPIWPPMFVPTKKILLHHTATSNSYTNGAAEVRAIHAYHTVSKGWGDIGYNALVDRFGNVYEGRRGRPGELLSSGVVAGHTLRHNYGTAGLAVIGDFTRRALNQKSSNDRAMLAALEDLTVYECGRAGLAPNAASAFLRSDDVWHDNMPAISGHKDSEATVCPGNSLYSYVNGALRQNSTNRLASFAAPAVTLVGPASRDATAPASLAFSWSGAASYQYRLEGWRKINSDDIEYWTPSGWQLAEPPAPWTPSSGNNQVSFANLERGHYTLHLRGFDASGRQSAVVPTSTGLVR